MPTGKPTNAEFPTVGLDPAGQHHDARAAARRRAEAIVGRGCAGTPPRRVRPRRRRRRRRRRRPPPRSRGAEAAVRCGAGPAHAVGRGTDSR